MRNLSKQQRTDTDKDTHNKKGVNWLSKRSQVLRSKLTILDPYIGVWKGLILTIQRLIPSICSMLLYQTRLCWGVKQGQPRCDSSVTLLLLSVDLGLVIINFFGPVTGPCSNNDSCYIGKLEISKIKKPSCFVRLIPRYIKIGKFKSK